MKYRSRMDISADILNIATEPSIKTRIMYKAFLSFPQLKEYLELLTKNGLLAFNKDDKQYQTTDAGKEFLHEYGRLQTRLGFKAKVYQSGNVSPAVKPAQK